MPGRWAAVRRVGSVLAGLVLGLVFLSALAIGLFSVYEGWNLTHPPARPVVGDPGTGAFLEYRCLPLRPPAICTPEPLFTAGDHIPISAWIVPSFLTLYPGESAGWSTNTVIMVEDAGQSRIPTGFPIWNVTRTLVDAGYNVVLFDTRGQGNSGGAGIGFGTLEVQDLLAVIQSLPSLGAPQGHIAVWGFGTGADAAILAGARTPAVSAVIADSPYLTPGKYLRRAIPLWTGLRPFPFADTILWAMQGETGARYSAYDPRQAITKFGGPNPRPLFLVGGDQDTVTPYADVQQLWMSAARAGDARAFGLRVHGAGHLQAFAKSPGASDVPQAKEYLCYVLNTLSAMQTTDVSARPNDVPAGPCGGVSPAVAAEANAPPAGAAGGTATGAPSITAASGTAAGSSATAPAVGAAPVATNGSSRTSAVGASGVTSGTPSTSR